MIDFSVYDVQLNNL